jgi:glycosyltransferase involved in cell wall biosynthesis
MNNEIDVSPIITILCVTYNQQKYIKECLDGLLSQRAKYSFEILIHDDASTDGTTEIILDYEKKYPQLFKTIIQKENQYSKGIRTIIATFMIDKVESKYIAICEGDDYWVDPYKLQKQVDILEHNEEYGMCYTRARRYLQTTHKFAEVFGSSESQFEQLVFKNTIPTLTTLYRTDLYKKYLNEIVPEDQGWLMGDYPMVLWFSLNSKIAFLYDITAVYRYQNESASHSNDYKKEALFLQNTHDIRMFFIEKYHYTALTHNIFNLRLCEQINLAVKHRKQEPYLFYISSISPKTVKMRIMYLIGKSNFLFSLYCFLIKL